MGVSRSALIVISFLILGSGVGEAQPRRTAPDIDTKIEAFSADIKQRIEEAEKNRQQREQALTQSIVDLRRELQLIRQDIGAVETQLKQQIDANEKIDISRADTISQSVKSFENRLPSLPPWVAIVVSAVVALITASVGAYVSLWVARTNRNHSDTQRNGDITRAATERKEDIDRAAQERRDDLIRADKLRIEGITQSRDQRNEDIARAEKQRKEDIDRVSQQLKDEQGRTRSQFREAASLTLVDQWSLLHDDISKIRGLLKDPRSLTEAAYSLVVKVGNWYERMAQRSTDGTADPTILDKHGLRKQAKLFWNELQEVQRLLAEDHASKFSFEEQFDDWQALRALASTP